MIKDFIQCCYCKANTELNRAVEYFNVDGTIAHGCSNCKNYKLINEEDYEI